jgi:predicted dehydrogenase
LVAVAEPVTLAVAGTGSRGYAYAAFAEVAPERARVVAVADPRADRRDALAQRLGVPQPRRYDSWRELADAGRLADAVVLATPDHEHAEATARFAALGYHILLEKPIAPTREECVATVEAAERSGVLLAVCHVLRYTPYSEAIRQLAASGRIGDVVGVEHLEPVGWWHFAHSFVRGNWRRADESGPAVLTKCCHDLDWLRYLVGRPAVRVSSHGGLHHFTAANRPPGAAPRCQDCAVEPDCPYSAVRFYLGCLGDPDRENWPLSVVTTDRTEAGVRRALADGPYGRCVYGCDNDVADHQVTTIEFEGGAVATLTMSAFTQLGRRRTRVMGTRGFVDADGERITLTDFVTGAVEPVPVSADGTPDAGGGHDGGDLALVASFVAAVATGDRSLIRSGPRESLESHLMAFAAERSRATGQPQPVWDGVTPAATAR